MSHSQIEVSSRLTRNNATFNCRVGRVIGIPEPIFTQDWTVADMLNDLPSPSILAEIFEAERSNPAHAAGRVLDFVKRS